MTLEDHEIVASWEEIAEDSDILDRQLERLTLIKSQREQREDRQNCTGTGSNLNSVRTLKSQSASIVLDSTTQESLRTQYVPPEPKLTILMRPKDPKNVHVQRTLDKSKNVPAKSLQQREQEYAEARMRILGDVRFEAEEAEAEMEATLSPAEILKLKVAEAVRGDNTIVNAAVPSGINNEAKGSSTSCKTSVESSSSAPLDANSVNSGTTVPGTTTTRGGRHKRSRENKIKTTNPESIRDFPVHKTDLERIIRHPRGPDGSIGFKRT